MLNGCIIPGVSLLSGTMLLSTLLKAEKPGAFENTNIPSTLWRIKQLIQASIVLWLSGPLSTATNRY